MADVHNTDKAARDFDEYRREMHPETEEGRRVVPKPGAAVRFGFGIFMILVYAGVGVLMLVNFFQFDASWAWARYFIGILLIIYAIFRAYREFRGQ